MESGISKDTLSRLQERLQREIPNRFHYPRLLSVLALQEEIGELLEELSGLESETPDSAAIDSELGDVLLSCIEIANAYDLKLAPAVTPAGVDVSPITFRVAIAAARVCKECLEIEGFERPRRPELLEALNQLVGEAACLAAYLDADLVTAFETKFRKILTRIEDGTWDQLYGNLLVTKRAKFD